MRATISSLSTPSLLELCNQLYAAFTLQIRAGIALLFAMPASIAGFKVASALLRVGSVGGWSTMFALAAALATGVVAAKRYETLPRV